MTKGTVFNIQKFSINDGPGIRTTVFLKGCPLRCIWCHNPESNEAHPELFYDPRKCIGCLGCASVCPKGCHFKDGEMHVFDRTNCIRCGACAEVCPTESLEMTGSEKTVADVMAEVMKDKIFYDNSGGGLTVSGGEPLMQFDFTLALFKAAKEAGLHTCIETCGFAPKERLALLAPYIDIFLFDYKETDSALHKEFTGVPNETILENLFYLDSLGSKIILRCPIIPTKNNRPDHFTGIAETANRLKNILEIHIEPYHALGSGKASSLGKEYPLENLSMPDEETVLTWIDTISRETPVPVKKA